MENPTNKRDPHPMEQVSDEVLEGVIDAVNQVERERCVREAFERLGKSIELSIQRDRENER